MINDKYALNQKAVTELSKYLKSLREKGGLSLRELGYYSDVTAIALGAIEKNKTLIPRLETVLRLIDYWQFSDEQIMEIYTAFCNKDKELTIIDKEVAPKERKVSLNEMELNNINTYFRNERKERKLKQIEIKNIIGIPVTHLSRFETGHESYSLLTLIPLCNFYEVKPEQVVDYYHRVFKKEGDSETINLDFLSRDELIQIILKQNSTSNRFYSVKRGKTKTLQKVNY